jgi:hypothetical protein
MSDAKKQDIEVSDFKLMTYIKDAIQATCKMGNNSEPGKAQSGSHVSVVDIIIGTDCTNKPNNMINMWQKRC